MVRSAEITKEVVPIEASVNGVSRDFFRYVNQDHSFFIFYGSWNGKSSARDNSTGLIPVHETEFFS